MCRAMKESVGSEIVVEFMREQYQFFFSLDHFFHVDA